MILENTIQQVKDVNVIDVVRHYVDLKKKGANYLGLCPFHEEKTGSFTVSTSKNMFKCFGCGKSGDGIRFIMELEGKTYPEAIELIAALNRIIVERSEKRTERTFTKLKKTIKKAVEFDTILFSQLPESNDGYFRNPLTKQLAAIYGAEIVEEVLSEYEVVIQNNWLTFPQIDYKNQCRTAKALRYENNAHRDHNALPMWLHSSLKKAGKISEDFKLQQCFTGEHLINRYQQKTIGIVEGQSTLLFLACLSLAATKHKIKSLEYFTRFVWICTGGSDGVGWKSEGVADCLKGRKVIAFPDAGFYSQWLSDAEELQDSGIAIGVSDLIEKKFEAGQLKYNDDLRDFLQQFTDEIKSYCSSFSITEDDIQAIDVPACADQEFGNLRLYTVELKNGSLLEILTDESGEVITAHEKLNAFAAFFQREFVAGMFEGKECLLRIIRNKN